MSLTPEEAVRLERAEKNTQSMLDMLELLLPMEFSLGELSLMCGKSRDTIRKHLYTNYVDGRGYHQKSEHGKIYVARSAALEIRRHYVK